MIWDSTLMMATIDIVIVLGAFSVLYVSFKHRATILRMQVSRSVYGIAVGTCVVAALYLADLYVMVIMPLYAGHDAAMAAMRHLHLNWSWAVVFAGLSCIVAGPVSLLARLSPRNERIIGSLETEVTERKRAETKLHEAYDRLKSHVERRTRELMDTNERLVREIAERGRSEKINTRLGRIVEDSVNEIYVLDGETLRFIQVNRGARENLGYSMEELGDLTPLDLKPDYTAETFAELIRPLRDGSTDQITFNTAHRRKDGTSYDVEVRLQLARGESPPVFFAVIEDVTERKRAESALRDSEASLVNAQRIAKLGNWDWNIITGDLHWSDQIYRIFGLEPQQFGATYEAFLQSVHPDDRDTVQAAVGRALSEGEPYSIDHRIVLPDGEERIVHEQGEVIFDTSGKPLRMSGTVQDITEQKCAESEIRTLNEELEQRVEARTEALRDSEEQLLLITDNVPAAIAYIDTNQRYEFINKRYEEWFGISSREAHGRRVRDVVGEASYNAVKDDLAKALSGKLVVFETILQTKDAGTRDVQQTYVPHFSDDGTVKGIFVLATDITERKRLEGELLRRERLATLGQLTATVSHELRNPLGVIRTSAYTLRAGLNPDDPRAARALARVERSVVRCDRIIDELLDFTRITELDPVSAALDDWLAGVLDEQALPAGLVLQRHFGLPDIIVSFDRDRFRRAVINVFENACQAMLDEEETNSAARKNLLTVRTQARAGRVEVVFEDQGSGIPAEVYERIFEPLFSTKGFGVGLGLPVVKQIMEQHGGGIEVETEVGHGTIVRLWLDPEANSKGVAA